MLNKNKKLFYIFTGIIIIFALIFFSQIKKALNLTVHPSKTPLINPQAIDIPINADDHMLGNPGAPLTIVEFASIGCKDCAKMHYIISNFISQNPTKVRLIWKDAPTSGLFIPTRHVALF